MFTREQLNSIREQYKRDHKPGPPVPTVRIWEVRYRELYDETHLYDDFRTTIPLVFPGSSAIDFAVQAIRERYKQSETRIDIVSVRTVSKAEYIRWLTRKVGLTDDSGRPTTPKRFAEQRIRFMLGLLETSGRKPIRSKDVLRLVPPLASRDR
jgi:hypothetical protein